MKVTLGQLYAGYQVLTRLVNEPLPIRISYRLTRLVKKINEEYQAVEENRNNLVRKYGEELPDGAGHRINPENAEAMQAFAQEFNTLLAERIDIDWDLMSIEELGDIKLTVRELNIIGFLFSELHEELPEA